MAEENEMSTRTAQVDQHLSKKNYTEALVLCLQALPGGGKSEEIKVRDYHCIISFTISREIVMYLLFTRRQIRC